MFAAPKKSESTFLHRSESDRCRWCFRCVSRCPRCCSRCPRCLVSVCRGVRLRCPRCCSWCPRSPPRHHQQSDTLRLVEAVLANFKDRDFFHCIIHPLHYFNASFQTIPPLQYLTVDFVLAPFPPVTMLIIQMVLHDVLGFFFRVLSGFRSASFNIVFWGMGEGENPLLVLTRVGGVLAVFDMACSTARAPRSPRFARLARRPCALWSSW